jgi:hypothetical protein
LPYARSRISFPVPEILMRFAVPLCVFNFGIGFPLVIIVINIVVQGHCTRFKRGTVEVGNYFFRIPTVRLRPVN